jgi:hypothetical protein
VACECPPAVGIEPLREDPTKANRLRDTLASHKKMPTRSPPDGAVWASSGSSELFVGGELGFYDPHAEIHPRASAALGCSTRSRRFRRIGRPEGRAYRKATHRPGRPVSHIHSVRTPGGANVCPRRARRRHRGSGNR